MRHSTDRSGRVLLVAAVAVLALGVVSCDDAQPSIGPVGPVGPVGGEDGEGEAGSGNIVTDDRDVEGFDRVVLLGEGRVVLSQGDVESLTVETDDNLLGHIETSVVGGTLEIQTTAGIDIAPTNSVVYQVGVVDLEAVEIRGVGSFEIDEWSADDSSIVLSGVGDIRVDALNATKLTVEHSGVGTITIAGTVEQQGVAISGLGAYEAADLETNTMTIAVRETASATVWVTDTLDVVASESGSVAYYGTPQLTQEVSGSGTINPLGSR